MLMGLWKMQLWDNEPQTRLEIINDEIASLENIILRFHEERINPCYKTIRKNNSIEDDEKKLHRLKKEKRWLLTWNRNINNLRVVNNTPPPVENATSIFKTLIQKAIW